MTLHDGAEALLVNGGGIDGGSGAYFANAGEDVHAVGPMAPLASVVDYVVIQPDGSRYIGRVSRTRWPDIDARRTGRLGWRLCGDGCYCSWSRWRSG